MTLNGLGASISISPISDPAPDPGRVRLRWEPAETLRTKRTYDTDNAKPGRGHNPLKMPTRPGSSRTVMDQP